MAGNGAGRSLLALGDSITAVSGGTSLPASVNFAMLAAWSLAPRLCYIHNAGVGGDTTAQMLARFTTDVTPYSPNLVTIMGGTNDSRLSVSLATFQANIAALVAAVRAIGATPIICTVPPNSGATGGAPRKALIAAYNAWLPTYCTAEGITLFDAYAVLNDPGNDTNIMAAYDLDGTHPNYAGQVALGAALTTRLSAIIP